MRRVGVHLRPVDRDHPDPHQPRPLAQPKHTAEQPGQRVLVAGTEPRDRRVIRLLLSGDHPVSNILHTTYARSHAMNVHPAHTRTTKATPPSTARTPRGPTHPDGRSHKTPTDPFPALTPTQTTPNGPPAANHADPAASRHLLTITLKKVLGHNQNGLKPLGRSQVCATPTTESRRRDGQARRCRSGRDSGARIVPRLTPASGRTGASRLRCHLARFPEDGAGYAGDRPHASLRFSRRSASSRSGSSGSISRELPGGSSGPVSGGGSKIAQFTNWSPSRER